MSFSAPITTHRYPSSTIQVVIAIKRTSNRKANNSAEFYKKFPCLPSSSMRFESYYEAIERPPLCTAILISTLLSSLINGFPVASDVDRLSLLYQRDSVPILPVLPLFLLDGIQAYCASPLSLPSPVKP